MTGAQVFALRKSGGGVLAFASFDEAEARCPPAEVKAGHWLFFADDGSPLDPRFEAEGVSGLYVLERAMSGRWLQERLEHVRAVHGCGLRTVDDLVETLKVNRGKRVARDH